MPDDTETPPSDTTSPTSPTSPTEEHPSPIFATCAVSIKAHTLDREDPLSVSACDTTGPDGSYKLYTVRYPPKKLIGGSCGSVAKPVDVSVPIHFQVGPTKDGHNGLTDEVLLAIVAHRMETKAQKNPHDETFRKVFSLAMAGLKELHLRTKGRKDRGIEGSTIII